DLVGRQPAAGVEPAGRGPDRVPDEPVDQRGVQVGPERTIPDSTIQHFAPHRLETPLIVAQIAEAGAGGQMLGLVLIDHGARAVPLARTARRAARRPRPPRRSCTTSSRWPGRRSRWPPPTARRTGRRPPAASAPPAARRWSPSPGGGAWPSWARPR